MSAPWWLEALCAIAGGVFFWGLSRIDPDPKPEGDRTKGGAT